MVAFALAFVFGSMGFLGTVFYFALRGGIGYDGSAWELAVAFPLSGFLGLMMAWGVLKLISPPDEWSAGMRETRCENCGWRRQVGEPNDFCSKCGTEYRRKVAGGL